MKMESIVLSYNENCPLHFVRAARIPTRYQACHVTYQLKISSISLWLAENAHKFKTAIITVVGITTICTSSLIYHKSFFTNPTVISST